VFEGGQGSFPPEPRTQVPDNSFSFRVFASLREDRFLVFWIYRSPELSEN
jgi:hypothetical protein